MSKERKTRVANILSDPELAAVMNRIAQAGGTMEDVAKETGYSVSSLTLRRVDMKKKLIAGLQKHDKTEAEINAVIPLTLVPFKRGGRKSTRNTDALIDAALELI